MAATTPEEQPMDTQPRDASTLRAVCAAALVVLAAGQLVAYLLLTAEPNVGIGSTAVLPAAAAAAVLVTGGPLGPASALAVVAAILGTRTLELSFDLARPEVTAPFAFSLVQLAACGLAVVTAAGLLVPRERAPRLLPLVGAGLLAAVAAGAALVVVSPQGEETGGLSEDEVRALPEIAMVDFLFEPAQLRVVAGQPLALRFINDGATPHSFAIEELGLDVAVPSGRTRTVVMTLAPGTYDFVCSVGDHVQEGMRGRVVVSEATDGAGIAGAPAPAGDPHAGHGVGDG